jgi:hypothetical protein
MFLSDGKLLEISSIDYASEISTASFFKAKFLIYKKHKHRNFHCEFISPQWGKSKAEVHRFPKIYEPKQISKRQMCDIKHFQKRATTNIRQSLAKCTKLRSNERIYSTAVALLSSCLYSVLAVAVCRGWSAYRQSERRKLVHNNKMPTCILYRVTVKIVRLLFGIPERLKTKQNYTPQNTWNRTPNSGSSQHRMQNYSGVQKLMFWQQCHDPQEQAHAEWTVCRILHHEGSYPQHLPRRQHLVPYMVLSTVMTTVQSPPYILFTDKAHFTENGITNTRNSHYWAQKIHTMCHNVTCNRDSELTCGVQYQTVIWLDRVLSRDS